MFLFFKSLADRGAAKGSNKRFGFRFLKLKAARTVTGFSISACKWRHAPEGKFCSYPPLLHASATGLRKG
ncbi:MAG: hypothetical protein DMG30_22405 [Acidobacteria bacterium]|nr:MAG: hypothetical protein DMG30_22405 [Acidobacteriota bacterium]